MLFLPSKPKTVPKGDYGIAPQGTIVVNMWVLILHLSCRVVAVYSLGECSQLWAGLQCRLPTFPQGKLSHGHMILVGDENMGKYHKTEQVETAPKPRPESMPLARMVGGFDFDFMSIQHLLSEPRTLSLIKKLLKPPIKLPVLLALPLSGAGA